MKEERALHHVLRAMMLVNMFILIYYVLVCAVSKSLICELMMANDFLSQAGGLPKDTLTICLEISGCYASLCILILVKEKIYGNSVMGRILICAGELFLSFAVIYALDFYYSGIALLVLADLVHYEQKRAFRVLFLGIQVLEFVVGNDEILSYFYKNVPFSSYLSCFHPLVRGWMIGVESLMTFMNILLFVFFVLLMFSRQKDENARILQLNWVLSYKNDQLRRANIKLKEYSETIRHMTETEERNRLAREIHDTLGHTLTGIVVSADAGKILMDAAPEEARKRFDVIADTARQGLEDVRRSIRALRPDALDRNGLWKALEIMVSDFHNSTGAVIVYEQNAGDPALASDEEDAVYRIVQEGLTNAIRHGQATRISLSIGKQEEYLRIRITDNGTGVREQKEGFGLNHMRERLEMLKGELKFGNRDDGESGACLEAVIPVRDTRPEVEE